jgi:drug/metabolite transporter (DMT)-like permease
MFSRLPKSTRVLLAFASVYFFWGSTYLAIHVAGEQMSVPVVSACRSTVSAIIIILICVLTGRGLRAPRGERWKLVLVGLLFMSANNMLLTWGEKLVPSGFASLIISTMPIMIALLDSCLRGGDRMNRRGWGGTLLGTAGILILVWPSLHRHVPQPGASHPLLGVVVLLGAAMSFAVGSVLSRRFHFRTDTLVATGWQIGAAGIFNWLVSFASGGLHRTVWTWHGVEAIFYLSIFGSIFGLVAFTYLLQNVAVTKVATYAFVNPIIAVLFGVLLLHERLARAEIVGMAVIIGAVAMVVYSRVNRVPRTLAAGVGDPTE